MAKTSNLFYSTKYTLPLMTGLIVGFAFSLLCMPFFDCDLNTLNSFVATQGAAGGDPIAAAQLQRLKRDNSDLQHKQQQQLDDFEPRINLQGKPKKPQKPTNKLIRPRYAATELGIREKLFVGVLVSNHNKITPLALQLNQTLSAYTNKLIFFVNNLNIDEKQLYNIPQGLSVINFNDNHEILKPFHTFKYILDNHINNYDWFVLFGDTTFVRGEKLLTLINHLSISQDLYMGNSVNDLYCSLHSGIILSNSIIRKLASQMEWCTNNAYSSEATDNIGRCVLHTTNLACASTAYGHNYTSYFNPEIVNLDKDLDSLKQLQTFNQSITFYPAKDYETMLKLQLYFDQVEVDEIKSEISSIEKNILSMACEAPEGCHGLTWPLGVPHPYRPTNRHEVIRWDYFNETHVYLLGDFDVVSELTEDYKNDINEVVKYALENLNQESLSAPTVSTQSERFKFRSIINGYKQFDPTRGATYIIDLKLWDEETKSDLHKRVNVMRPLGLIELVSMPYVTENSKVTIIVTFSLEYDKSQIDAFFLNYEHNVLEISEVADKVNLYIVYCKPNDKSISDNLHFEMEDNVRHIKKLISELEKKYSSLTTSTSRILQADLSITNYTLYLNENYRQLQAIELLTRKLSPEALVFLTPPGVEFQLEFLNRVRLNTIKAHQVFFPIAFYQYQPNIIYEKKPYPEEVDINKNIGYFNTYSFDFATFYNHDYINTRNTYIEKVLGYNNKTPKTKLPKNFNLADYVSDLYELFVSNKTLNIMRGTDIALKYRWHLVETCENRFYIVNNSDNYEGCMLQLEHSLGNRAQLALHLIHLYKDSTNDYDDKEQEQKN